MSERDKEEREEGFKITDRRLFTPEGERRPEVQETAQEPPPPPPAPDSRPQPEQGPPPELGERTGHEPVSFEHLVMSLATTAMFQLGLVKNPQEENPRVDLPAAKETIDLLEILQQKTKGNLTPAEENLLTGSLYELHMVFVELSGKTGRSR